MPSLKNQIESLLFISPRPLTFKKLAELLSAKPADVQTSVEELVADYKERGLTLKITADQVVMASAGDCREVVENFVKHEITGELTRPSLETLTIIAYRGPVSKAEIELIRGVNCSLIIRNLLIRGLIEEVDGPTPDQPHYIVSLEFLKFLNINSVEQLPDYNKLNADDKLTELLASALNKNINSDDDVQAVD